MQKWEGGGQGTEGQWKGGREVAEVRGQGRRIRWRVPELTPKTPGPVASADYETAAR